MSTPQFFGAATAEADEESQSIYVEVTNKGWSNSYPVKDSYCSLTCEDAARLAEQIDAAIDLLARTARAKAEARKARIAGLKETLAELEAGQ